MTAVFAPLLLILAVVAGLIGGAGHHPNEQAGSVTSFHLNAPMRGSDSAPPETLPLIAGSDPALHPIERNWGDPAMRAP